MKKRVFILVSLILVSVLLISLVSAFSWDDFWNTITGKIIDEGTITCEDADLNNDSVVDDADTQIIRDKMNQFCGANNNWCGNADLDRSGRVRAGDITKHKEMIEECKITCEDANLNSDGIVDDADYQIWQENDGRADCSSNNNWCDKADINKDSQVTVTDFSIWKAWKGTKCSIDCADADLNNDSVVDDADTQIIRDKMNQICNSDNNWCDNADLDRSGRVRAGDITKHKEMIEECKITFNETFEGYISVATLKDKYNRGEVIELTDPPDDKINEEDMNLANNLAGTKIIKEINSQEYIIDSEQLKRETEKSKYKGYIIELKEKPVLEKRAEELDFIERKRREAEELDTSGIKATYNGLRKVVKNYRANRAEENLETNLKKQKEKIEKEHNNLKSRLSGELKTITGNVVLDSALSKITGRAVENKDEIEILNEYEDIFNGISLDISDDEAKEIEKLLEVKDVYPNYEVHTTLMDSVPLINADDVWLLDEDLNNCSVSEKDCLTGENTTIAIIEIGRASCRERV